MKTTLKLSFPFCLTSERRPRNLNMIVCSIIAGLTFLAWPWLAQGTESPETTENPSTRLIVGGQDSLSTSWPWQAGLLVAQGGFICGGTLIEYDTVLTVAHCVNGLQTDRLTVVLGDYNRDFPEGREQFMAVRHVSVHPLYDNDFLGGYDIALLHLDNNATQTPSVKPIPALAKIKQNFTQKDCYITGWGLGSLGENPTVCGYGNLATKLQEATITIINNSQCNSKKFWNGIVKTTNICAFYRHTAACKGDSGGPLVCKSNGSFVLLGTTSWGATDCDQYPTVFTKVSVFRHWIKNTITEKRKLSQKGKNHDSKMCHSNRN